MTMIDTLLPGLAGAGPILARTLPAEAGFTTGDALHGAEALDVSPGEGSRAVVARLSGGITGQMVLVVAPSLALAIEQTPVGPQSLQDALATTFSDLLDAISSELGTEVHTEVLQTLDADVALGGDATGTIQAIPVFDGETHQATLVLMVESLAATSRSVPHAEFEPLAGIAIAGESRSLDLLQDVEMGVSVELGRTRMSVRDLLSLTPGSVVELDRAAGSPVDLLVNGTLIARGEVVVIDEEFGIRISEIVGHDPKR